MDLANNYVIVPSNWQDTTIFISELVLWALVSQSKKDKAKKFLKLVFEEVLSTLRKDGLYVMPNTCIDQIQNISIAILKVIESNQKLCEKIHTDRPKKSVIPKNKFFKSV